MIDLAKRLFPINRSITGNGVRETLKILGESIPLQTYEVPTGTPVFDWVIPKEWNVKEAFVVDMSSGKKVIDFANHNLHLMGYSIPVNAEMSFEELEPHLYYLEEQPNAIPYITSYYKERWGFCLCYHDFQQLDRSTQYKVVIDATHTEGSLTYGEAIVKGKTDKEIFISTYVCHPSMANNELSGPVVATHLCKWIQEFSPYYTYRFVFIPETIGSITYLSKNIDHLKDKVVAGFNLSCVGDERTYSYLPSRNGNTLSDKVALHVLKYHTPEYKSYTWLDRGSDERQYCAPGVDLPICGILRSKFGQYPEYHTSLDNFDVVTEAGLQGALEAYQKCIMLLENNFTPRINTFGEPNLGKRGLYPTISAKNSSLIVRDMMNFLSYCDGTMDVLDICDTIDVNYFDLKDRIDELLKQNLISRVE